MPLLAWPQGGGRTAGDTWGALPVRASKGPRVVARHGAGRPGFSEETGADSGPSAPSCLSLPGPMDPPGVRGCKRATHAWTGTAPSPWPHCPGGRGASDRPSSGDPKGAGTQDPPHREGGQCGEGRQAHGRWAGVGGSAARPAGTDCRGCSVPGGHGPRRIGGWGAGWRPGKELRGAV